MLSRFVADVVCNDGIQRSVRLKLCQRLVDLCRQLAVVLVYAHRILFGGQLLIQHLQVVVLLNKSLRRVVIDHNAVDLALLKRLDRIRALVVALYGRASAHNRSQADRLSFQAERRSSCLQNHMPPLLPYRHLLLFPCSLPLLSPQQCSPLPPLCFQLPCSLPEPRRRTLSGKIPLPPPLPLSVTFSFSSFLLL